MEYREQEEFLPRHYPTVSKEAIARQVARLVDRVEAGDADPLKTFAMLAGMEDAIKKARQTIKGHALDELAKYAGEKSVTVLGGAQCAEMEAGINFDYSGTPRWCEIKEREDAVAAERKALEARLKTVKTPGIMSEGDEVFDVVPPVKTSTTTIKVTIK